MDRVALAVSAAARGHSKMDNLDDDEREELEHEGDVAFAGALIGHVLAAEMD